MLKSFFRKCGRRKPLHVIVAQEAEEGLEAELGLLDLLCIGIGSTVGSGVFVLTGSNLLVSGPVSVICWILAGIVCLASGLSYMELSARIPTKGSCYIYTYNALGEFMGVVGAACLTLEYGISGSGVARSWSPKFLALINEWRKCEDTADKRCDVGFRVWYSDPDTAEMDEYFDTLAFIIHGLCVCVCLGGLSMGKKVINSFTMMKVLLVFFMTIVGFAAWSHPDGYGVEMFKGDNFSPYGITGILLGTSKLFFGYIGFDEVACLAGRSKNPSKIMPWAIGGTLAGTVFLSSTAQLAVGGIYSSDNYPAEGDPSFEDGFLFLGWKWANVIVHYGETLLMPIVVLLIFIVQPELNFALAEDGMLPVSFTKANSKNVLVLNTIVSGVFLTLIAGCVPFDILWDVISLGVLASFNLTNTSLMAVRHDPGLSWPFVGLISAQWFCSCFSSFCLWPGYYANYFMDKTEEGYDPNKTIAWMVIGWILLIVHLAIGGVIFWFYPQVEDSDFKGFKAPLVPFIPTIAMFFNFFLIAQIPIMNIAYLCVWIAFCVLVYFIYGMKNSARNFDDRYDGKAPGSGSRRHSSMVSNMVNGINPQRKRTKSNKSNSSQNDYESSASSLKAYQTSQA